MSSMNIDPRSSIESCCSRLHQWQPFQPRTTTTTPAPDSPTPYYLRNQNKNKKKHNSHCRDHTDSSLSIDALDLCNINLHDESRKVSTTKRLFKRKRQRGSVLVWGMTRERSETRMMAAFREFLGNVKKNKNDDGGEKESVMVGLGKIGNIKFQEDELGYPSEPDYRGDAEWL